MADGLLSRGQHQLREIGVLDVQDYQDQARSLQAVVDEYWPTAAQWAWFGSQLPPGTGMADAVYGTPAAPTSEATPGQFYSGELQNTFGENVVEGNLDAIPQAIGILGDALYMTPFAAAGPIVKGGGALTRLGLQKWRKGNVPEDVDRLEFNESSAPQELAEGTERRFSTTGQYRGAPQGIDSPQKLAAMQKRLRDYAEKGASGKYWYENTNDYMVLQSANRPGVRDRYAATAAITSQGTSVGVNAPMAMKGYNQGVVGDRIDTGRFPNQMRPEIEEVFTGISDPLGPKREPFFEALNQQANRARQTNDIRQARAFGFKNKDGSEWDGGLSDAQHRFIDEETDKLVEWANKNKVGGNDDWNRDRLQAAVWIAQKAEQEGTTIEQAGRMFQDYTPEAIIRTEAMPSTGLDHMTGALSDPDILRRYSQVQDEAMLTPQGTDYLSAQSGALTGEVYSGPGLYEGASNPGVGIPVSVGKLQESVQLDPRTGQPFLNTKGEPVVGPIIDPSSRKLVEANAAMHGLLRGQDTVGYTSILPASSAESRNAMKVDLGGTIDGEALVRLDERLNAEFGDMNLISVHSADGVEIFTSGDDAFATLLDSGEKSTDWQKKLKKIVKEELEPEGMEWGTNTGKLVGDTDTWSYKPSSYLEPLEAPGPEMRASMDVGGKRIADTLSELDQRLLDKVPDADQRNDVLNLVRTTLSREGVAGIRRLVKEGALPAFVLTMLGTHLTQGVLSQEESDPPIGALR